MFQKERANIFSIHRTYVATVIVTPKLYDQKRNDQTVARDDVSCVGCTIPEQRDRNETSSFDSRLEQPLQASAE